LFIYVSFMIPLKFKFCYKRILNKKIIHRGQPELNWWPLDMQSNSVPLSYTPTHIVHLCRIYDTFRYQILWNTYFEMKQIIHRGATWAELMTSWSAVKCSATKIYPNTYCSFMQNLWYI
jgi:hypothetical protein